MVGSRGSAPTGRFTYRPYHLAIGSQLVHSLSSIVYPLKLIRASCGTRFRGMRSLTFAACSKKKFFSIIFTTSPLVKIKLDPRLLTIALYRGTIKLFSLYYVIFLRIIPRTWLLFLFLFTYWQIMPFGHITPVRMVVCRLMVYQIFV